MITGRPHISYGCVTRRTVTYGLPANLSLATLRLVAGEWLEIEVPVELNDWVGWDYLDSSIRGPVQIANTVTVTGGGSTTGNYVGTRDGRLSVARTSGFRLD